MSWDAGKNPCDITGNDWRATAILSDSRSAGRNSRLATAFPDLERTGAAMPKQKTHKGMKKRFKVTGTGKVKHKSAHRGHKLSSKTSKRKRGLRQDNVLASSKQTATIVEGLRPSL